METHPARGGHSKGPRAGRIQHEKLRPNSSTRQSCTDETGRVVSSRNGAQQRVYVGGSQARAWCGRCRAGGTARWCPPPPAPRGTSRAAGSTSTAGCLASDHRTWVSCTTLDNGKLASTCVEGPARGRRRRMPFEGAMPPALWAYQLKAQLTRGEGRSRLDTRSKKRAGISNRRAGHLEVSGSRVTSRRFHHVGHDGAQLGLARRFDPPLGGMSPCR